MTTADERRTVAALLRLELILVLQRSKEGGNMKEEWENVNGCGSGKR